MFQHYQLKNKANVYLIPKADATSVTFLIGYPVGSRYESAKLAGASHFVEHLMFKGTKKRPSALILTREIDRLGAQYNAFTGKENTGYYIKVDADYTETAADILSDMLFDSKFDASEMEREKTVIVEEIRMYQDNPVMNIDSVFENLLYQGCPLGRDVAGSEETVMGMDRGEMLQYLRGHYRPSNMTIVVAGKITDDTKKYIEHYFGAQKNNKKIPQALRKAVFGSEEKDQRIVIQAKKTDQAQLMLGFPGFPHNHEQNVVVSVLDTILGESMSSRLFMEIREKRGLAYMIRSGAERFRDSGYFFVRAGLESKNINEAIKVIKHEMESIVSRGVTQQELKDAKTNIRGSLMLSLEDSAAEAGWYASQALFAKKIKTPEEKLKEIDAVTNAEIKEVAKKLFKMNQMRVAIIGNVEKKDVVF